eukprot:TRINITY_DN60724_c0_g1_i1.p1 TRINITY_DN60724_c0_g1~~TRINITY_DN60724_c0_g1_i1.p1  ORF type:complete len:495 (+),score=125.58 TRINITY_DN60724_c0_g1_i1:90-1574(+)
MQALQAAVRCEAAEREVPHEAGTGLALPHSHSPALWAKVPGGTPTSIDELKAFFGKYAPCDLGGLHAAFTLYSSFGAQESFFAVALPAILARARALPELSEAHPDALRPLHQGTDGEVEVPRDLAASLLANMFLCTFQGLEEQRVERGDNAYYTWSFRGLLETGDKGSRGLRAAKLHMVAHYFTRIGTAPLPGCIRILRRSSKVPAAEWSESAQPLTKIICGAEREGFESSRGAACVRALFSSPFPGTGVLSTGALQEEAHFASAPETIITLLFCPRALRGEVITVVGAQVFSNTDGVEGRLRYAGDFKSEHASAEDDTALVCVSLIDALDGAKSERGYPLVEQLEEDAMLYHLNKAHAGCLTAGADFVGQSLCTGNWGCGKNRAHPQLMAILQWLAASATDREMRYLPFDKLLLGPELVEVADELVGAECTVGCLWTALSEVADEIRCGRSFCAPPESDGARPAPGFPSLLGRVRDRVLRARRPVASSVPPRG